MSKPLALGTENLRDLTQHGSDFRWIRTLDCKSLHQWFSPNNPTIIVCFLLWDGTSHVCFLFFYFSSLCTFFFTRKRLVQHHFFIAFFLFTVSYQLAAHQHSAPPPNCFKQLWRSSTHNRTFSEQMTWKTPLRSRNGWLYQYHRHQLKRLCPKPAHSSPTKEPLNKHPLPSPKKEKQQKTIRRIG